MLACICFFFMLCCQVQKVFSLTIGCRSREQILTPNLFEFDSCALCYWYIPNIPRMFKQKWNLTTKLMKEGNQWQRVTLLTNSTSQILANMSDSDNFLFQTFENERAISLWLQCCRSAMTCCDRMISKDLREEQTDSDSCPQTWDGWQCWNRTLAGRIAVAPCPHYIHFITEPPSTTRYANKECTVNGTWLKVDGVEWSNYTTCSIATLMRNRVYMRIAAYSVSSFFLFPALIIFFYYQKLQVHRVRIHRHLFISLFCNGILEILFQSVALLGKFREGISIIETNSIPCRILLILTKYFREANYMWMFNEAFYLHHLLTVAFNEQTEMRLTIIFGWALPAIPVIIYIVIRLMVSNQSCWIFPVESYEWILFGPCLVCLLMNIFFLANIIRILLRKLQCPPVKEPTYYRKTLRAIVFLVPLFGLHFIITIYRPSSTICEGLEFYCYFCILMDGLQGCLVSFLFCYCNGEVMYLLRRSICRYLDRRFPGYSFIHSLAGSRKRRSSSPSVSKCKKNSLQIPMKSNSVVENIVLDDFCKNDSLNSKPSELQPCIPEKE